MHESDSLRISGVYRWRHRHVDCWRPRWVAGGKRRAGVLDQDNRFATQVWGPSNRSHYHPDKELVTFEVHSYSKKLSPLCLDFQLIPILVNRGVTNSVFSYLVYLYAYLKDKFGRMDEAMGTWLSLRWWNQEETSILSEWSGAGGIEMLGASLLWPLKRSTGSSSMISSPKTTYS